MQLVESRSIDYVPLAERHGKVWHLWPIWFSGDAHLATLATGAIGLAAGLGFGWSVLAILAGGALGTLFMASHSSQGPELGLPQMIQSRPQFGYRGALLVWCFALVTYIGYTVFNAVMFGVAVQDLSGTELSPGGLVTAFGLFTLMAMALAICGYDWIHLAQRVLAAVVIGTLALFSVGIWLVGGHSPQFVFGTFLPLPFLVQFFAAAGYQLSWSIYVSDYSRYLPRDVGITSSFWWTFLGAFIGGAWMMLAGAAAAALFPGKEIVAALISAGNLVFPHFGPTVVVLCALPLLTITTLNLYGGSLTLLSILDSFRHIANPGRARLVALGGLGIVSVWLAAFAGGNVLGLIERLLSVLIYLFTPWTAINLVDFFFVRHGHYSVREIFNPDGIYGRWNWRGLLAYGVGFLAMVPCFATPVYTGPIAHWLGGADVSMLVGLPVSSLVYYLACRSLDLAGERAHIEKADAGLEDDAEPSLAIDFDNALPEAAA
ncbi:cytosine/purine/uracil/thiamine/allantoin permease family protein [Novosphingobium nitrogenifigens DSM 19370]|uniref:Cytosine/purine/uracil/thiamine/allantoin permease family protein n=1 Tax=Novosphingobium nitrogenifigens DSM 19370 TaxID=983920 RepID=F1ZCH0_9SPHN|nr:cytosine permease [Novosphingobium nitrogenifigens]EGD57748.1 cytosine/purine/uracil/thiamine/allantoin permease family protein [Novosphingobium nitrogenifigens DSM 19370]